MNEHIKVSVIIPVYNVENYLEKAVDSVLAQTLKDLEIILVDDGSSDASGKICDTYVQNAPDKIRVIHKKNDGLGMARNSGIELAKGEYIAFLDSDDEVHADMYKAMYEKAKEEDFDMVFCDVEIIYVAEQRKTVVETYPESRIDVPDYIAHGNNITYSVNKLYKRKIWQENRYEKMLFEDIALIPCLVTKYPHIGYVKKPFYQYYRRPNTISTTVTGEMVDIIRAFRSFLDNSNPSYKDEVVYCTAKQLYWNMYQSRTLFGADFVSLIQKYKKDFLLNPYLEKDKKMQKILDCIDEDVIPETFILANFHGDIPASYEEMLKEHFPAANVVLADAHAFKKTSLPTSVQTALEEGKTEYVEEYYALLTLYEQGGIVLFPYMKANLRLKMLRFNKVFFGFEDEENLTAGCFGAQKGDYVIQALLDTYREEHIYNQAFLPLKERIRDFLILYFNLNPNGKNQLLKNHVRVYLPSILSYDMKDEENCCKIWQKDIPEGFELVSEHVLKMWSKRILDNWNLYKKEKAAAGKGQAISTIQEGRTFPTNVEEQIQKVVETYENSTCWKLTKPLRILGEFLKKS